MEKEHRVHELHLPMDLASKGYIRFQYQKKIMTYLTAVVGCKLLEI